MAPYRCRVDQLRRNRQRQDEWQPERDSVAWHVSAMTGMRRGEVLGLRWADVDLDAARLHVRHALVSVAYELVMSTPKNHRARVIDLDAGTVEQLRQHQNQQALERTEWGGGDYNDRDVVF